MPDDNDKKSKRKKKLNQYGNRLSPAHIAAGMNATAHNARRLYEDAFLLMKEKRYPSVVALSVLSIEESGKTSILRQLAVAQTEEEITKCWRDYRSHTKKNAMGGFIDFFLGKGARKLEDFRPLFDENSDYPFALDQVKQISIYTDCLGVANWSIPTEVIDEKLATSLLMTADILSRQKEKQDVTVKEIELWIKHMGPVWVKKDMGEMERALVEWHEDMQKHGLAEKTETNTMRDFVERGLEAK